VTRADPVPAGAVATICVSETTEKGARTAPKKTSVASVKTESP
jgi:hypothetical protein